MSQYFYYDGQNPVGPHSATEVAQLLQDKFLPPETLVFVEGTKEWQPASTFPELMQVAPVNVPERPVIAEKEGEVGEQEQEATVTVTPTPAPIQDEPADDEEEEVDKGLSKYQILRLIRTELDKLWTCQRESIISAIKNEELDTEYVQTRRQAREMKINIENLAIDYFRKSNVLKDWIQDLTWESTKFKNSRADVRKRLQGTTCQERYDNAMEWLEQVGATNLEGCYCFINSDRTYRYIGKTQARTLGQRLKEWERASFWLEASHLRIVVPKFKSQTTKLERLMIMLHQPMQNEKPGDKGGNNPADKVLAMIHAEIHDLLIDG